MKKKALSCPRYGHHVAVCGWRTCLYGIGRRNFTRSSWQSRQASPRKTTRQPIPLLCLQEAPPRPTRSCPLPAPIGRGFGSVRNGGQKVHADRGRHGACRLDSANYNAGSNRSTVLITLPEGTYSEVIARGTDEEGVQMDVLKFTNITVTAAENSVPDDKEVEFTPAGR